MGRKRASKRTAEEVEEVRLQVGLILRTARLGSKYAKNLSAAARAAGMSPGFLCRLECGESGASAATYTDICKVYGISPGRIYKLMGKLEPTLEERLVTRMDVLHEVLELVLSVPDDSIPGLLRQLREVTDGTSNAEREGKLSVG